MKEKQMPIRWLFDPSKHNDQVASAVPELVLLGYDRFNEASSLTDHLHEHCFEFVYMESGKASWVVDGDTYASHTGQLFHTRPNEWHRARLHHIEPCSIWWIIVTDPTTSNKWLRLAGEEKKALEQALHSLPRVITVDARVRSDFHLMRDVVEQNDPHAALRIRHCIADIVLQAMQPRDSNLLPQDLQESMASLALTVERNPEQHWTIERLAGELGVSESHVYRVFRQMHGQSPAAYIERLRIDQACLLLVQQPDRAVTDIAFDLGFKTSQHFATVFKKCTGHTPSQWRKLQKDKLG